MVIILSTQTTFTLMENATLVNTLVTFSKIKSHICFFLLTLNKRRNVTNLKIKCEHLKNFLKQIHNF